MADLYWRFMVWLGWETKPMRKARLIREIDELHRSAFAKMREDLREDDD